MLIIFLDCSSIPEGSEIVISRTRRSVLLVSGMPTNMPSKAYRRQPNMKTSQEMTERILKIVWLTMGLKRSRV